MVFPLLPLTDHKLQAAEMLSLLNLIIASGTVLRSDTEPWSVESYPDPRLNHSTCNVPPASTLCDPDHILTDQWRETINANIQAQMKREFPR